MKRRMWRGLALAVLLLVLLAGGLLALLVPHLREYQQRSAQARAACQDEMQRSRDFHEFTIRAASYDAGSSTAHVRGSYVQCPFCNAPLGVRFTCRTHFTAAGAVEHVAVEEEYCTLLHPGAAGTRCECGIWSRLPCAAGQTWRQWLARWLP
jgi:hypothetical protein